MSDSSKEQQLWDACTSGDLDLVRHLVNDEGVNVNWADPEYNRTAFLQGLWTWQDWYRWIHAKKSQGLMWTNHWTLGPLLSSWLVKKVTRKWYRCFWRTWELKSTKQKNNGSTPFFIACERGHKEVVSLLLAEMRIDVNKPLDGGYTPFYMDLSGWSQRSGITAAGWPESWYK